MTAHYNMIRKASVLLLALIAGFFFLSAYGPSHHESPDGHAAAGPAHLADAVADAAGDVEALADMHAFVALHLGEFVDVSDSFGSTPHYSDDWRLAWITVVHDGHIMRIYHLTNKHNHDDRLVAASDVTDGSATGWQPLH